MIDRESYDHAGFLEVASDGGRLSARTYWITPLWRMRLQKKNVWSRSDYCKRLDHYDFPVLSPRNLEDVLGGGFQGQYSEYVAEFVSQETVTVSSTLFRLHPSESTATVRHVGLFHQTDQDVGPGRRPPRSQRPKQNNRDVAQDGPKTGGNNGPLQIPLPRSLRCAQALGQLYSQKGGMIYPSPNPHNL